MGDQNASSRSDSSPTTPLTPTFLRLYWMVVGNAITVVLWINIAFNLMPQFKTFSVLFFLNIAGMITARYTDIRYHNGETSNGDPATMGHWKKYVIILSIVAGGLWILGFLMHRIKIL
jgi:hypothetical protein